MKALQKLIGQIYRPYKFKVQRRELTHLLNALVDSLPDDYRELKEQRQSAANNSDFFIVPSRLKIGKRGVLAADFPQAYQMPVAAAAEYEVDVPG